VADTQEKKAAQKAEMRHLIRIASTEIKGELPVKLALTQIKGVGDALAKAVIHVLKLDGEQQFGLLSEAEVARIEACVMDPVGHGFPAHLINCRKDPIGGKDTHQIGTDLDIQHKNLLDRMKKIKSYKGMRHAHGLKVRGQRTKSTGRKGKTLGVSRTKIKSKS